MRTRTAAALAGFLLSASPVVAQEICPGGGFYYYETCRAGQFTFKYELWIGDSWWTPDGWLSSQLAFPEIQVFKDHIDFITTAQDRTYVIDPKDYPLNWGGAYQFAQAWIGMSFLADDPLTRFYAGSIRENTAVTATIPEGAYGYFYDNLSFFGAGGSTGGGKGCGFEPQTGTQTCGGNSYVEGFSPQPNPYFPGIGTQWAPDGYGEFFSYWEVGGSAQWQGAYTDPLTISLTNPGYTVSVYFTTPTITPEPATILLMASGLAIVGLISWKRHRAG
jgi:hypothetical protein